MCPGLRNTLKPPQGRVHSQWQPVSAVRVDGVQAADDREQPEGRDVAVQHGDRDLTTAKQPARV